MQRSKDELELIAGSIVDAILKVRLPVLQRLFAVFTVSLLLFKNDTNETVHGEFTRRIPKTDKGPIPVSEPASVEFP